MMEKSDIIIANLTPFAGASADAGTLIEVGSFTPGRASRYLVIRIPPKLKSQMRKQLGAKHADLGTEGFHLPDNLMIVGAVQSGGYPVFLPTDGKTRGFDALDVFRPA